MRYETKYPSPNRTPCKNTSLESGIRKSNACNVALDFIWVVIWPEFVRFHSFLLLANILPLKEAENVHRSIYGWLVVKTLFDWHTAGGLLGGGGWSQPARWLIVPQSKALYETFKIWRIFLMKSLGECLALVGNLTSIFGYFFDFIGLDKNTLTVFNIACTHTQTSKLTLMWGVVAQASEYQKYSFFY